MGAWLGRLLRWFKPAPKPPLDLYAWLQLKPSPPLSLLLFSWIWAEPPIDWSTNLFGDLPDDPEEWR